MDRSPARFHRRQNNNDGDQTRYKVGARAPVECCGLCANCGSAAAACIEDDATGVVEGCADAGRHDAGRVVLLDDQRAFPRLCKVGAADHGGLAPAVVRAEIGAPGRGPGRWPGGVVDAGRRRGGPPAAAQHAERDQLDRLFRPGTVAVGALMLRAEGLFERGERVIVERAVRQGDGELVGLALIVEARVALDRGGGPAVAVGGEPAERLLPPARPTQR